MKKMFYIGPKEVVWNMTYEPWMEMFHTAGGPIVFGRCQGLFMSYKKAKLEYYRQMMRQGRDIRNLDGIFGHKSE